MRMRERAASRLFTYIYTNRHLLSEASIKSGIYVYDITLEDTSDRPYGSHI